MSEFFAMGGYTVYVWSAFAITAMVFVGNYAAALYQFKRAKSLSNH